MIEPRIQTKLRAFQARRRRLLALRGLCAAVVCALAAWAALAAVDFLLVLEDWQRYVLAGLAYLAIAGVTWWVSLRLLWERLDDRALARLVERARPDLREDLLAAVELGEPPRRPGLDSAAFRHLVQANVAARLDEVTVTGLLPRRLIGRWARAAVTLAAVCLVLVCLPRLRFGTLLVRAAVPTANLERVSRVQLKVLEPAPADTLVPANDALSILVEVSAAEVRHVTLELATARGPTTRLPMDRVGPRRFGTVVKVGTASLTYRIRAGDGLSRRYTLVARPRPEALSFAKRYRYPAYTGAAARLVKEAHGALEALEGTTVDLSIQVNQPTREAALAFETDNTTRTVPLARGPGQTLTASVPLDRSGTYRVRLVAAETGFENTFSPQYEIRAQPDLLPTIALLAPTADLTAAPDDTLDLTAVARDDVGIGEVRLGRRHNGGAWVEDVVVAPAAAAGANRELRIDHRLDLLRLGLTPGDELNVKLAVTDLKGSRAETPVRTLAVSASTFAADRHRLAKAWAEVSAAGRELSQAAAGLERQAAEIRPPAPAAAEKQPRLLEQLATAVQQAEDTADRTLAVVRAVLPRMTANRGTRDLVDLGRTVSRLRHEYWTRTQLALDAAPDETPDLAAANRQLQAALPAAREQAAKLAALADRLAAEPLAVAVAQDFQDLAAEQGRIAAFAATRGDSRDTRDRVRRRESILTDNAAAIAKLLAQLGDLADPRLAPAIGQARQTIAAVRQQADPLEPPPNQAGTFLAEYYATPDLAGEPRTRRDATVDFNWGEGTPLPGLPTDHFSARWTGRFNPPADGQYTFYTVADDGVRLWLDGTLVIDNWQVQGPTETKWQGELKQHQPLDLRLEYFEATATAVIKLDWSGPGAGRTPLQPAANLGEPTAALQTRLEQAGQAWQPTVREIEGDAQRARQELALLAGAEDQTLAAALQALAPAAPPPATAAPPRQQARELLREAARRLADRADLEDLRPIPDAAFVKDLGTTADTLGQLQESVAAAAAVAPLAADLQAIATAARQLEAGHELREASATFHDLALAERWPGDDPAQARDNAKDWAAAEARLQNLAQTLLPAAPLSPAATAGLQQLLASQDANDLRQEMLARRQDAKAPTLMPAAADRLDTGLARIKVQLLPALAAARRTVAHRAPTLAAKLDALAHEAQTIRGRTLQQTRVAALESRPVTAEETRLLLKAQEAFNDRLAAAHADLRREANAQDLADQAGRDQARDAEDALAMLRLPPPRAEDLLRQAAAAPEPPRRFELIQRAIGVQGRMADHLEDLAAHYAGVARERPEPTRRQLRAREAALGIKNQLDEHYALAEAFANLPARTPKELLNVLENRLAADPAMQRELTHLARQATVAARQTVAAGTRQATALADQLQALSSQEPGPQAAALRLQAAAQQTLAATTRQAGDDLARAGRHERRLGLERGRLLEALGDRVQHAADGALSQAARALATAPTAAAAQLPVSQAREATATAAADLARLLAAEPPAPRPADDSPVGAWLARALDRLDRAQARGAALLPPDLAARQVGQLAQRQTQLAAITTAAPNAQLPPRGPLQQELASQAQALAQNSLAAQPALQQAADAMQQAAHALLQADKPAAQQQQQAAQDALNLAQQQLAAATLQAMQEQLQALAEQVAQADRAVAAAASLSQQQTELARQTAAAADPLSPHGAAQQELANQARALARDAPTAEPALHQTAWEMEQAAQALTRDDRPAAQQRQQAAQNALSQARQQLAAAAKTARQQQARAPAAVAAQASRAATAVQQLAQQQTQVAAQTLAAAADQLPPHSASQQELAQQTQALAPDAPGAQQSLHQAAWEMEQAAQALTRGDRPAAQQRQQAAQNALSKAQQQLADATAQARHQAALLTANPQRQQPLQEARTAVAEAARQQARTMIQARHAGSLSAVSGDLPTARDPPTAGASPVVAPAGDGDANADWGQLPPRLARDLKDARQENVPDQYRAMVNSYFKVIAERSRKKE